MQFLRVLSEVLKLCGQHHRPFFPYHLCTGLAVQQQCCVLFSPAMVESHYGAFQLQKKKMLRRAHFIFEVLVSVPTDAGIQRTIQMQICNRLTTGTYMMDSISMTLTTSLSPTGSYLAPLANTLPSTAGVMVAIECGMWHLPSLKDYGDTIRSSVGTERRMMKGQPVKVSLRVSGPHYYHPIHYLDA